MSQATPRGSCSDTTSQAPLADPDATREALFCYLFISPWLLGFLIWTAGPILYSLFLSFTEYNIIAPPKWIGLANYHKAFVARRAWSASRS